MSEGHRNFDGYKPQCRCIGTPMVLESNNPFQRVIAKDWMDLPVDRGRIGVPIDTDHDLVSMYTYEGALALCFWFMALYPYSVECRVVPYKCKIDWQSVEQPDAAIEVGCAIDAIRSEVWHRKEREEAEAKKRTASSIDGKHP